MRMIVQALKNQPQRERGRNKGDRKRIERGMGETERQTGGEKQKD